VGLPGIRDLGLRREDFADLARRSVHNGSNGSNPRAMGEEDYIHVLERLWVAGSSGYAVPAESRKGTPDGSTEAGPEKGVPGSRRPEVVRQRNRAEEINTALFRISNAINTTHDLSELYASIHDTLARIIDVTNFYIAVHEPERGVLTFPYHQDETDDDFEDVPADLAKVNSLTGQVFLDQRPVLLHERQLRERKAEGRVQGPVPLVWLGVPLMVRNKVIGVMAIQSYTDPNRYDDTDVEVLTAVSEQIAVAVERKRAEEALARSERRFREMADLLPTIICEIDQERRIRYMNRMGLETFSGPLDAGEGSLSILDLIHPEDRDRAVDFLDTVTEEGGIKGTEVHIAGSSETETAALIHASTIAREGEVRGMRLCITDVTQRKRLEAELQRTHKMETIGTLAGGIAHDFNNILAIIMGSLSLAKTGRSTGEDIEVYLANAEEATITARDLIQRFITFSKAWQPAKKRTPIREIVESSVRFILDGTPITCRIVMPDSLWPVEVDRAEMGRAINNLVMNAREAMPRGGTLDIQAENLFQGPGNMESDIPLAEGPYLKIAIGDQGPGIAREHLPFIFDPYFSTKERGSRKGMGLGLTTAYAIVQKHRGLLQAESSPGRGTTFLIYLPAHPPD
jgi:PAS domain S-box-containing protein